MSTSTNGSGSSGRDELPPPKLYTLRDPPSPALTSDTSSFDPSFKYNNETPIVIDNGSWQTRVGFAHDPTPRFVCPPTVSRYLDRKMGRKYQFGGYDVHLDANSRGHAKTVFDSNVVANFDALEMLLDYVFIKLGLEGGPDGGIGHPLVMTEAVCNPGYSRKMVSELVFEAYNAPSVVYGIDALFSYHYNGGRTGLVVSSGNTATHLIPVLEGRGITSKATRLNWGGSQGTELMLKLLQLKYPEFPSKLQTWQAEALVMDHCYVSGDYKKEVGSYLKPEALVEKDRTVQFPFTETVKVEKSQEELDKIAEKRKESGRRLQEQAAKARLEKLIKNEQELEYYRDLRERSTTMTKRDFKRALESNDFDSESQLDKHIASLEARIKKARKQDVGEDVNDSNAEPPSFPLLDIPDEELDEEGKKQKRQQRLMKSNYDARQRARAEKEREKARIEEEERLDNESRERDLEGWVNEKRAARETLLSKIKDRQRLRMELNDRKSLASRARMENIASLASDNPTSKKRRRGGAGGAADADDTFGADDDDWSIYRSIGTGGTGAPDEDFDEDAELNKELQALEGQLLEHDPDFAEEHTREAQSDWSRSILHAFTRGVRPWNLESQAEANQMHINIERIRVPEVVFEPSMAGLDQAGLVESASDILMHRVSEPERRAQMLKDVFLTGGNTAFEGFGERLKRELTAVMPAGIGIGVRRAANPVWDAWRGAAKWCGDLSGGAEWRRAVVTRQEWEEKGGEYLKEMRLGNAF